MAETIKITGLSEIKDKLEDLDRKTAKSITRKGLRAGAKEMLAAARAEAPVLSGRTRDNLKIRSGRSSSGRISMTVGVNAKDFTGTSFYAAFVLYGHKVGSRKLGDQRKEVPANNWLERAFDESHDQAAETATDTIGELIQKEAAEK